MEPSLMPWANTEILLAPPPTVTMSQPTETPTMEQHTTPPITKPSLASPLNNMARYTMSCHNHNSQRFFRHGMRSRPGSTVDGGGFEDGRYREWGVDKAGINDATSYIGECGVGLWDG